MLRRLRRKVSGFNTFAKLEVERISLSEVTSDFLTAPVRQRMTLKSSKPKEKMHRSSMIDRIKLLN